MRTVSSPSQVKIALPVTQPGWFVELAFASGTVRICSFGTTSWNSLTWTGANFTVDGMSGDGRAARLSIWDPTAAYRTISVGGGIRNRAVKIWQAQAGALLAGDPNMVYKGVGDGVNIAKGRVEISLARLNSRVMLAPRQRISPATGFNFLAAPGKTIAWGDVLITLGSRRV